MHAKGIVFCALVLCMFASGPATSPPQGAEFEPLLDHVAIHVQDLKRSAEFYRSVLHLERIEDPFKDDKHVWFRLGAREELHVIAGRSGPVRDDIDVHLAVRVTSLPKFCDHLRRLGVNYVNARREQSATTKRPDGVIQVYLQDPDGYWIEVNDRRP